MAGGKDQKTLVHRVLTATAGCLASATAVDWHLKVEDIEYDVCLTKHYCITLVLHQASSL